MPTHIIKDLKLTLTSGTEVVVHLEYDRNDTDVKKVTVTSFSANGLLFKVLKANMQPAIGDEPAKPDLSSSEARALATILNPEYNVANIALYGAGNHANRVEPKVKLWGNRADTENPLICVIVYDVSTGVEVPVGFVNLGLSGILLDGHPIHEGGTLYMPNVSPENKASAIAAVFIAYFDEMHAQGVLDGTSGVIYTVGTNNEETTAAMLLAGMNQVVVCPLMNTLLGHNKDGVYRFKQPENPEGTVYDEGRPVSVFYHAPQQLVGEVNEAPAE